MSEEAVKIEEKKGFSLNLPTAILLAGVLVAGAVALPKMNLEAPAEATVASYDSTITEPADRLEESGKLLLHPVDEDDYVKGAENPKITLVEFSDFGCGFCGRFHPVLERLLDEYPDDLAWVYRQLPYRHMEASRAAECVGQELGNDAFWSFTDTLFQNQQSIDQALMNSAAEDLGLSASDLEACMETEEIAEKVQRDFTEATIMGVRGTPHTVAVTENGREFALRGALGYDELKGLVDSLLTGN